MKTKHKLLTIENLSTHFFTQDGVAKAVQGVSFDINKARTFALVGESGCGKSVTALSIMNLIPKPPGKIVSGSIFLEGDNLVKLNEKKMRRIRGNRIAMIFQEPMTSLNPVFTIGDQIAEAIKLHQKKPSNQAWQMAIELLKKVGIPDPDRRVSEYPHQMSGGMRQRVMIAMAVSCNPDLLIADEPTTALDVTTQSQILELLSSLQKQNNMAILLITHDLGIVAERADQVAVMYASRIVETSSAKDLFAEPMHPYTQGLLKSIPTLGCKDKRLYTIEGNVPNPLQFPTGCKFHPRCPLGCDDKRCQRAEPELRQIGDNRTVACWYAAGYETENERKEYEKKYGKRK
ncbi:MAG: ABC transporter ATP-binding protein [Phycisphaerae bacterium]|nr:ABC transporter ATP-binding protein [Phycisphaerae bacterium]